MAKRKIINLPKAVELTLGDNRNYAIKEAAIKDDFCNYTFEITAGIGVGTKLVAKGSGIIKDDLKDAFSTLRVHLACIDDVFKHSGIEIEDIDKIHDHELTYMYDVTGIKMKGTEDNPSVILVGNKYISISSGRIEIATPKISIDNLSSYKWYNELKTAIEKVREEVALYKEGKYEAVEMEDETPGAIQLTIGNQIDEMYKDGDDHFKNAKV